MPYGTSPATWNLLHLNLKRQNNWLGTKKIIHQSLRKLQKEKRREAMCASFVMKTVTVEIFMSLDPLLWSRKLRRVQKNLRTPYYLLKYLGETFLQLKLSITLIPWQNLETSIAWLDKGRKYWWWYNEWDVKRITRICWTNNLQREQCGQREIDI